MGKSTNSSPMLKKLGLNIQRVRKDRGVTQEELAEKVDMHRTYISLVELGKRNPTISTIYAISKALKVSSKQLLPF